MKTRIRKVLKRAKSKLQRKESRLTIKVNQYNYEICKKNILIPLIIQCLLHWMLLTMIMVNFINQSILSIRQCCQPGNVINQQSTLLKVNSNCTITRLGSPKWSHYVALTLVKPWITCFLFQNYSWLNLLGTVKYSINVPSILFSQI